MRNDHEVELMYAPNIFGLFQPGFNSYSPWGNVVLRVVPPRPCLEDLVLQFLNPDDAHNDDNNTPVEPAETLPQDGSASDSTPNYDISEQMAREMQDQEDREQEMRDRAVAFGSQIGNLFSSLFGSSHEDSARAKFYQEAINAEAGPSTVRKPKAEYSANIGRTRLDNVDSFSMRTEEGNPLVVDESNIRAGKQRAQPTSSFNFASRSNPLELLDNIEAALRHEVNKFDFPERLDFLDTANHSVSTPGTPPAPVLSHASDNAPVRGHEQALSDLLANLDVLANCEDEDLRVRQDQLGGRIRRELEELDRKVLEAWAASRRYTKN